MFLGWFDANGNEVTNVAADMAENITVVAGQELGTKKECIRKAMQGKYGADKVLMVGDAPGDCDAAEMNGVHYYPILVNNEKKSWDEAVNTAFAKLQSGEYAASGKAKKEEFLRNLGG